MSLGFGQIGLGTGGAGTVSVYMLGRAGGSAAFTRAPGLSRKRADAEAIPVLQLKERLAKKSLRKPTPLTVQGTFYPAQLLFSGWWERQAKSEGYDLQWRDDVQRWLFHGFEQWGPSWDFSSSLVSEEAGYLVGQLADGDEANSLTVLVRGEKIGRVRQYLHEGEGFFQASVRADLWHRSQLPEEIGRTLVQSGDDLDYCLVLDPEAKEHSVERLREQPDTYSAYLWQCLAPIEWLEPEIQPRINDVYFVWEHTDLTKPDAVAYNLEALESKAAWLRRRHGDLMLLQKSSARAGGEDPAWSNELFYELLLPGTRREG